ncbi:hypothetical protein QTG54_007574 [Skeletonema marinoi]|uniref:MBD domain-containing protein n=1 Tax=Skeletonema marinoi TaxID=267567 RepID=A0AAD9DC19_9STRA|nr:hypothetical protein QTG54_007574 [Skeletonema marinoi]
MNKDDDTIKGTGQAHSSSAVAAAASTNKPKSKRLCKEISCPKFKQGKCNGYCVACFQKFGETTCRDPHCINKNYKDGYCVSHLASVDDGDAIAAKPVSESATKKKKAVAAAKPAKPVKRKRDYRERYTFPATSTRKKLRIDANSKNPNQQTITKGDLLSLVDSVLKETRHAKSSDGEVHYLLDEIRDSMNKALESSLSHKVKKKSLKNDAPIEIQGISEEAFTAEEIALMPVVFAYHCDDAESEQNAKIATLDYEVEQSRLKRKAAAATDESNSSSGQVASKRKPASPAKSVNSIEDETERVPADDFPGGWKMQSVPRTKVAGKKPFDTYYYSPKLGLKFRSRPEVKRFIALLDICDDDEEKAFAIFKGR